MEIIVRQYCSRSLNQFTGRLIFSHCITCPYSLSSTFYMLHYCLLCDSLSKYEDGNCCFRCTAFLPSYPKNEKSCTILQIIILYGRGQFISIFRMDRLNPVLPFPGDFWNCFHGHMHFVIRSHFSSTCIFFHIASQSSSSSIPYTHFVRGHWKVCHWELDKIQDFFSRLQESPWRGKVGIKLYEWILGTRSSLSNPFMPFWSMGPQFPFSWSSFGIHGSL